MMTVQTVDYLADQIVSAEHEDFAKAPIHGAVFESKSRGVSVIISNTEPLSLISEAVEA